MKRFSCMTTPGGRRPEKGWGGTFSSTTRSAGTLLWATRRRRTCIMGWFAWRPERGAPGILRALDDELKRGGQKEFGGGKRRGKVAAPIRGRSLTLPKDIEA